MSEKIKIGGELDPITVDKILGDASTIVDRTNYDTPKTQSVVNSEKINISDIKDAASASAINWDDEDKPVSARTAKIIKEYVETKLPEDVLIDHSPTEGSSNAVDSNGVYNAIKDVAFSTNEKIYEVGIDSEPTSGSNNLIKSSGVYAFSPYAEKIYNVDVDCIIDKNWLITPSANIKKLSGEGSKDLEALFVYNMAGIVDGNYYFDSSSSLIEINENIQTDTSGYKFDDSITRFFSSENIIEESNASYPFMGFTQCLNYNGKIYIFYRRAQEHGTVAGSNQYYWWYKYSSDNGKTWSEVKNISIENYVDSTWDGYRDNRGGYLTVYDNKIIMLGVLAPSSNNSLLPYRTFYGILESNNDGILSLSSFHLLPDYDFDSETIIQGSEEVPDSQREYGTNCISGKIIEHNGYLYWMVYSSIHTASDNSEYQSAVLLKWEIDLTDYPKWNTIEVIHLFDGETDNRRYCEASLCVCRDVINISVLDYIYGNNHDCNYNYIYNPADEEFVSTYVTEQRYAGVETFPIENKYIIQTGRASIYDNINRNDFMAILTGGNVVVKELLPLMGHNSYNQEGMYCGIAQKENTLFISYYYIKANNTKVIAYKTIDVRDISNLLIK